MSRIFAATFAILILGVLALPALELKMNFFDERGLSGEWTAKKLKPVNAENLLDGSFQHSFDAWFADNIGFRGPLVRIENQINYKLFGDLDGGAITRTLLGKDKMLYQKAYVKSIDGFDYVPDTKLRSYVESLRKLQDYLEARGKLFVLVLVPTKASLYPEGIPERYRAAPGVAQSSNYERLLPILAEYNILTFDAQKWLWDKKSTVDYKFFAPSAAHWNDVASCEVGRELWALVGRKLDKVMMDYTCGPVKIKKPKSTDLDLLRLCNLYDSTELQLEAAYPLTVPKRPEGAFLPRVLMVGDSFLWPLVRFLDWHRVHKSLDIHYYNNVNHHYPGGHKKKLKLPAEQWLEMLNRQDVVVINSTLARIHHLGLGYLEEVDRYLPDEPS